MNIYHYIVIALFLAFAFADHFGSRHDFPNVRFWRVVGVASFVLYYAIATLAPFLWDAWLGSHQLLDLTGLPFVAQVIGFLVLEFGIYFWHRTMHGWDMLFGTFRNPRAWEGENGFHPGSIRQIGSLLIFRKIG